MVKQSKIPKISWMTSQRLFDFYDKEDDQLGQENVLSKDILVYKEYQEGRGQEIMCDKLKKKDYWWAGHHPFFATMNHVNFSDNLYFISQLAHQLGLNSQNSKFLSLFLSEMLLEMWIASHPGHLSLVSCFVYLSIWRLG